ncbi:12583_t:CDS:2 [Acaulospora morrowiae]|uniref:12583_t:CDS:1 n=1 Tax=Acaulospora morrowiae TaxID=94023 RepID=A0A9N8VYA1_9GLOM|nr:12583_t:CDS:2 [Acaulospora morrowiae]
MSDDYLDKFLKDLNITWLTSHKNKNLPINIYKGNILLSDNRQLLLQMYS